MPHRTPVPVLLLSLAALTPACSGSPVELGAPGAPGPDLELPPAELRVLFVGNSLTASNDLPARVQTVAEALGRSLSQARITFPGVSLEEHWAQGTPDMIRELAPDVVVLQQGPSSLPRNQDHLRHWSGRMADVIREAGGEPALLMVWPSRTREHAFDDVRASYRGAARAVDGLFIPAGEAWRDAWSLDPGLALWGPDGFHPSPLGTTLAALTAARVLLDQDLRELPSVLRPTTPGLPVLDLGPGLAPLLYEAVETAVSRWSGLQARAAGARLADPGSSGTG